MRLLIIVQDLRVSGTSEGIVSLLLVSYIDYPEAVIDVHYFMSIHTNMIRNY
jgi:hypothetical protein